MNKRKQAPVLARARGKSGAVPKRNRRQPVRGQLVSAAEFERLQERLRELTETVDALRTGAVAAVVVSGPNGNQIYSLTGAEQPYRLYVERMQEGAVTISGEGVILYTNQRFADMLDLPLERVIGSDIRSHIDESTWTTIAGAMGGDSSPVKHATLLNRHDQPPLPVNLSASGLDVDDQEMLCLVVTDLSAQQENNRLRMAKEVAERASMAKDEFLAALSHELRTPLTPAMVSAATLERDASLPVHLRQDVEVLRRNIELEARLIDDLLDLTRLTRGKLELRMTEVDVDGLLKEAITICQPDISAKRLSLHLLSEAARTRTAADAVRIEQVLWNLLRNAVKFTPEGGCITIITRNPGSGSISISFSDTGIGFDSLTQAKLFAAFEQGGRHITRQFGGLGLGLAISRSIAEAHAGTITASSAGPGRGAVFTLHLPLHDVVAAAAAEPPRTAAPHPHDGERLRILLVEDHADTRQVLERALRRSDHHILSAANARGALELAERNPLDVVISDLGLPDSSGLDLMRQLRDRFGLRGIAVSGYGMEEDVARSHSAGFVHHMTKPISVQRLRELLRTLCHGNATH